MKLLVIIFVFLCFFTKAQTAVFDTLPFTTNGPVYALHKKGNNYFIGGDFTKAGTRNDFIGKLALNESHFEAPFPLADNTVLNSCSDNAGGFFILGAFSTVGDSARTQMAHINSSNKVTGFVSQPFGTSWWYGTVNKMLCYNNYIFICGQVTNGIIVVNKTTGAVIPGLITTNGSVYDIEIKNNKLYMVGDFYTVNSVARMSFACIDLTTFNLDPFMPVDLNTQYYPIFMNIEFVDSTFIIGGNFLYEDAFTNPISQNLIEFSMNNGAVKTRLSNYFSTPDFIYYHKMKLLGGDTLLLARDSLVDIYRLQTNTITTLATLNTHTISGFNGAELSNNKIYISGDFKKVNNLLVNGIFKIQVGSVTPQAISYMNQFSTAKYYTMQKTPTHFFLGGDFVEQGLQASTGFVCYDDNIKEIVFNPTITNLVFNVGKYVRKIKEYQNKIYVIGVFHDVNSQFKPGLFVIDANTFSVQALPSFSLGPCTFTDRNIYDIAFKGNWMYVYGYLTDINGVSKINFAKVNLLTNAVSPNNYLCSGSWYGNFAYFNPLIVQNNQVYVFPDINYTTNSAPTCGPGIWGIDSTGLGNCNEICSIDTTKYSYIEEVKQRGNKLYCIDVEKTTNKYSAYTYDFSTNSYSSVLFTANCPWVNSSNHSVFFKNTWVIGCEPQLLNGVASNKNLIYWDTISNSLINYTFNPLFFNTALFSNDSVLLNASFPNQLYVFKTASPSIYFSTIYRVSSLSGSIITDVHYPKANYNNYKIAPNPTDGILKITSVNNAPKPYFVKVYNTIGELVLEEKMLDNDTVNLSKLVSGIYFIRLYDDKTQLLNTIKAIKE